MTFKLEAKEYQERVAKLELTVDKLQRELKSLKEAGSDTSGSTVSENEATTVVDLHNVEGSGAQQHDEVNL